MSTPLQLEQHRRQQGYIPQRARPACSNCKHQRGAYTAESPAQCRLGGFAVTWFGICDRFQPNREDFQPKPLSP